MNRYVSVGFNDLDHEAKEGLIETIKESLFENAEEQGKEELAREWHDPKPKTWQEAYIRAMSIDHIMWEQYENGEDDAEEPKPADWEYWLDEHLIEEAENKLCTAFKYIEVEVEI